MQRYLWTAFAVILLIIALANEHSLRLDVSEGAIAGFAGVWAHPKHPPLPFFLIEFARPSYWLLFAVSYACIAVGILMMRQFSKTAAVLCLAFPLIIYAPAQMNHNIALYPLAAATLYTLWTSLNRGLWRDWLLFGAVVGVSFYAKYAILLLLTPFAIAMLIKPEWRKYLFTPKPYAVVLLALLILSPHIKAMVDISEVARGPLTTGAQNLSQRLQFTVLWLLNFALLIIIPLVILRVKPTKPKTEFEFFALIAAFGAPFIVFIATVFFGIRPRPFWLLAMTPGFALWLSTLKPLSLKPVYLYGFMVLITWVSFKLFAPLFSNAPQYADYDAKETAKIALKYYGKSPDLIVSFGAQRGRQLAGSLLYELETPTNILEEGDRAMSPWVKSVDKALVISTVPLEGKNVMGRRITDIRMLKRPIAKRLFGERLKTTDMWLGRVD
jgi:hypothetical protein